MQWQPETSSSGWKEPFPRLNEGEDITLLEPAVEIATKSLQQENMWSELCSGRSPLLCRCTALGQKGSRAWAGDQKEVRGQTSRMDVSQVSRVLHTSSCHKHGPALMAYLSLTLFSTP